MALVSVGNDGRRQLGKQTAAEQRIPDGRQHYVHLQQQPRIRSLPASLH